MTGKTQTFVTRTGHTAVVRADAIVTIVHDIEYGYMEITLSSGTPVVVDNVNITMFATVVEWWESNL